MLAFTASRESEANEHITHILQAKCLLEVILLSDIVLQLILCIAMPFAYSPSLHGDSEIFQHNLSSNFSEGICEAFLALVLHPALQCAAFAGFISEVNQA